MKIDMLVKSKTHHTNTAGMAGRTAERWVVKLIGGDRWAYETHGEIELSIRTKAEADEFEVGTVKTMVIG